MAGPAFADVTVSPASVPQGSGQNLTYHVVNDGAKPLTKVTLRVPPGTTNGRKFRVKGAGVQRKDVPGDLIVTVEISVPQKLSSEAKTALEAFANAQQADPREAITKALRSRSGTSTAGAAAS